MRAVGPTIDAGEPTHSTTAHPKHSRALSASPAQWRDGCIAARGAAEPGPLALTLRTLWAFRATSAALSELGQTGQTGRTGQTGQTGECAPGVVASSRLSPAHARRASCHRRTKERGWQWVKFLARWVQAEVAGRSRARHPTCHATWHAPGTQLGTHLARTLARTWHATWHAPGTCWWLVIGRSGGHCLCSAAVERQSVLGSTAAARSGRVPFFRTRLSEFLLSRGHRLGHAAPSGRRIRWMGAGHERLRPSGEQSGDTWVARTCSRLRARSHW